MAIIKHQNSDFIVREVSCLPSDIVDEDDCKAYTHLTLSKVGLTTLEALSIVADIFNFDRKEIRCQGLKDEDGITSQTISMPAINKNVLLKNSDISLTNKKWIKLSYLGSSNFPVREKMLHGNTFTLKIRDLSRNLADRLYEEYSTGVSFVCLNYYDSQRFGLPGGPYVAHDIGRALVDGDYDLAHEMYSLSGNLELDFPQGVPRDKIFEDMDQRKLLFFLSAYDSYVWNRKLSSMINASDLSIEIFQNFNVRSLRPESILALPHTLESDGYFLSRNRKIKRRIKSRVASITSKVFAVEPQSDYFYNGRYSVDFSFFLPAGSYATMFMKQLLRSHEEVLLHEKGS